MGSFFFQELSSDLNGEKLEHLTANFFKTSNLLILNKNSNSSSLMSRVSLKLRQPSGIFESIRCDSLEYHSINEALHTGTLSFQPDPATLSFF